MTYTEYLKLNKVPQKNPNRLLVPRFPDPVTDVKKFSQILHKQKIVLESVTVSDPIDNFLKFTGLVRTLNLGSDVHIRARYFYNKLNNFSDVLATEIECPFIFSKRYSFTIYANSLDVGDKISFVVVLTMPHNKLWDAAEDKMYYTIDCLDATKLPKKFVTFLLI